MKGLFYIQFSHSVVFDSLKHRRRMPDFLVHHQLSELAQTHVHWVCDVIQPFHPLSSPFPPAFNLFQYQGLFKWGSSSHEVAKELEIQLQHQSFQWIFRADLLENGLVGSPCSPRDSQEPSPAPQLKSINSLALSFLYSDFPGGSEVKASASNAGDPGSIPESGRSPGKGNGNPLQYSCLENPMDGETW